MFTSVWETSVKYSVSVITSSRIYPHCKCTCYFVFTVTNIASVNTPVFILKVLFSQVQTSVQKALARPQELSLVGGQT